MPTETKQEKSSDNVPSSTDIKNNEPAKPVDTVTLTLNEPSKISHCPVPQQEFVTGSFVIEYSEDNTHNDSGSSSPSSSSDSPDEDSALEAFILEQGAYYLGNILTRRQFEDDYFLVDNQYDLLVDFFQSLSNGKQTIRTDVIENNIIEQLKTRKNLVATDENVRNAIKVVDSDNDNQITFGEFLDFISLFFASKHNLKQKIHGVLNGHDELFAEAGYLNRDEAKKYLEFFRNFYSIEPSTDKKDQIEFEDDQKYESFLSKVVPSLENHLFVRW